MQTYKIGHSGFNYMIKRVQQNEKKKICKKLYVSMPVYKKYHQT